MISAEKLARQVAIASIGISAALAVTKIVVGLAADSVALVSDGFESAADFFTSGLVLAGLWVASKPPDQDHPYGHGRFETHFGLSPRTPDDLCGFPQIARGPTNGVSFRCDPTH